MLLDLATTPVLALAGPPASTAAAARGLALAAALGDAPAALVALAAPARAAAWSWLGPGDRLVAPTLDALAEALAAHDGRTLVLLDAAIDGSLAAALATRAVATPGVGVVALAPLPAGEGRALLELGRDRRAALHAGVDAAPALLPDLVPAALAAALLHGRGGATALAAAGLAALHGLAGDDLPAAVLASWATAGAGLPWLPGAGPDGPIACDLERDGPHALVAGTTGSGKSALLEALVVGLALRLPPTRVAFILIDFKGGAAFAPLADLPHVAAIVTDLDDGIAERAVEALGGELRRREELLHAEGAPDLRALATRAPSSRRPPS